LCCWYPDEIAKLVEILFCSSLRGCTQLCPSLSFPLTLETEKVKQLKAFTPMSNPRDWLSIDLMLAPARSQDLKETAADLIRSLD
jgi:hypothetical protein